MEKETLKLLIKQYKLIQYSSRIEQEKKNIYLSKISKWIDSIGMKIEWYNSDDRKEIV